MKIAIFLFLFSLSAWAVNPGDVAPEFKLTNQAGAQISLSDFKNKIVVLEWFNNGCPFVKKHYGPGNMQTIQATYKDNPNVVWLTIASSAKGKQGHIADASEAKAMLAQMNSKADHLLLDHAGSVGQAYGAKTTPHMFIIGFDGKVAYAGAIDSIASADSDDIKEATNYVTSAVSKILLKEAPNPAKTKPYGCSVKY